jgi:hypothetical protein
MKRPRPHSEYESSDLQISTSLKAAGAELRRIDWKADRAYFVFADRLQCERLVERYWSGELIAPAKVYFGSLRELKDQLFASKRAREIRRNDEN